MSTEWIIRAGFLRDVQPGMTVTMAYGDGPSFLVTDRADAAPPADGGDPMIVIAGQDGDGNPIHKMGAGWRPIFIHHAVPSLTATDRS